MPTVRKPRKPKWVVKSKNTQDNRKHKDQTFYNSRNWRKVSKLNLSINPMCVDCMEHNVLTKATVTDHIIPIQQGGSRLDPRNHQSLCSHHHAKKSGQEAHGKLLPWTLNEDGDKIPKQ